MRSIFISYRRGDAEGQAGRLFDDLVAQFGKTAVFMDVEDIEPGRDFRKVIDQHVSSCGVLLALVGKGWLDATDHEGHRRLDDPNDFVRLETASALKRDIPVIPVLVQGAAMPKADSLPDDLKEFAFRNAVELTHARWESDVQLLIRALGRYVDTGDKNEQPVAAPVAGGASAKASGKSTVGTDKEPEKQHAAATSAPPHGKKSWIPALVAAIIAIALSAGGYIMYDNTKKAAEEQKLAAQKAAIERLAAEKATEEQKEAAAKAEVERTRAEKAVEEVKSAAARARAERAEAIMAAQEQRLAAERAAAEKAAEEKRAAAKAAAEKAEAEKRAKGGVVVANADGTPPVKHVKKAKKARKIALHSRGDLAIPQTWTADLDEGKVGGEDADIWFQAVTGSERYLTPRNGAGLCVVSGDMMPSRETCANAIYNNGRISINNLQLSTRVCVRTNNGRFASFKLLEPVSRTLKIMYVCYE